VIENGIAKVAEGMHENAVCTISADDETYANVELGKLDPTAAFMAGQIKVDNLQAMMQFSKMFNKV
jgi:putative sterol carrier protein